MNHPDFDDEEHLLDDGLHPPDIEPVFDVVSFAITPRALVLVLEAGADPWVLSARHQGGDWGLVDNHDRAVNDAAVREGGRKMSVFLLERGESARRASLLGDEPVGERVLQITEPNGVSTILLPSEY